jgi:hypothetical protein
MAHVLPIFQAIKVTPKSIIAGHPRQIVELLANGVATAIVKSKSKDSGALFECLLRCPLLAPNVNLPVYFCLDNLNQPLTIGTDVVTLTIPRYDSVNESAQAVQGAVDEERAREWNESLELALSYWAMKMEEAVLALYPDRKAKQVDAFASQGIIEMKVSKFVKDFNLEEFLATCARRNGFPVFKLAYTWIGSKEDQRSKDHIWGMKFDFSNYGQFPVLPRTRKPALSTAERQTELLKKRKVGEDGDGVEIKEETA